MYLIFSTKEAHDAVNDRVNAYIGHSGIGVDTWSHGLRCGDMYAMPIIEKIMGALTEDEIGAIVMSLPDLEEPNENS